MKLSKDTLNAVTVCGFFVLLIFSTIAAPYVYSYIAPYFKGGPKVAQICKPHLQGLGGLRLSRARAEMLAISKWAGLAGQHGQLFSLWSNARAKKMRCRRLPGSPVYNCAAKAQPCKNLFTS